MRRLAVLALIVTACTSPNREHDDPADLCASDPPPVQSIFRIDGDGEPKGWSGWVDGRRIQWLRYEDGAPATVVDGSVAVKCYRDGMAAEVCVGDPSEGCDCYLPGGESEDCENVWPIWNRIVSTDGMNDGADSPH